ncbi:multidrug efflux permease, partial [mine drainage metagenome]
MTLIVGSSFGSIIYALLAYLTYVSFNPLITALAFILSSISGSLVFPSSSAMVSDLTSTEDRSRAYSIYRVVTNLGWAIGPITGAYLSLMGMQWIFVFLSCASILQLGIILVFVRESMVLPAAGLANWNSSARPGRILSRDIIIFSLATFLIILVASQFSVTLPVYANTYAGVREWQIGYIYAVNGIVVVLGQIPMNLITRKLRDTTVMM